MDLLQTILNARDGEAVQRLGDQVGLDPNQAMAAVQQLVPALAVGLSHNMTQSGGLDALVAALSGGGHQQYLDDPSRLGAAETLQDGNGILGHIFGSKDVSRQVAAQASANTGISPDILKQMLPLVATLAMGAMARRHASAPAGAQTADTGLMGMLGPLLGGNSGGGSVANDVMGMLGKFLR